MTVIRWTEEAQPWLRDIHDYIAANDPGAAAKVIAGIYQKIQLLSHFPEMGHIYGTETKGEGEVRVLLYGHYRIAYLWRPAAAIDVLGVFHGAIDVDRYVW